VNQLKPEVSATMITAMTAVIFNIGTDGIDDFFSAMISFLSVRSEM
jgi:hypothetical protein